jgi:hypothetical protein
MKRLGLFRLALLFLLIPSGLRAGERIVEVKKWSNPKGAEFVLNVDSCSGAPFQYNPKNPFLTELIMVRNSGGFVTIQGKITNPAPWRKTCRVRWEWKAANGMVSTTPADEALVMVTLEGHEKQILTATSTIPDPSSGTLTFFSHAK